jgi:hypothetical protein
VEKQPCIRGYFGAEPFGRATIETWPWARAQQLGWALPPGIVLLDIDVKAGKVGLDHLAQLQLAVGRLPDTAQQASPSGGRHLLFRLPRPVRHLHGRVPLLPADGNSRLADIDVATTGCAT